jgi:hypothetical protein
LCTPYFHFFDQTEELAVGLGGFVGSPNPLELGAEGGFVGVGPGAVVLLDAPKIAAESDQFVAGLAVGVEEALQLRGQVRKMFEIALKMGQEKGPDHAELLPAEFRWGASAGAAIRSCFDKLGMSGQFVKSPMHRRATKSTEGPRFSGCRWFAGSP